MLTFALDIGGTSVKSALINVVDTYASIVKRRDSVALESREFGRLETIVMTLVQEAVDAEPSLERVGIATTGSVNPQGVVISAGFFSGYRDISWSAKLRSAFRSLKVIVTLNDGQAAAWGEYRRHGERGRSLIHAVIGTGVGGGIVEGGTLVRGDQGRAGYIGHLKVAQSGNEVCSCGSHNCIETLAAGPAIVRQFNELAGSVDLKAETLADVTAHARSGNKTANDAFEKAGYWLGFGLGNAMNVVNPTIASIGGGVALASDQLAVGEDGGPYFRGASSGVAVSAHPKIAAACTLRLSQLGNDAGLLGAATLAAEQL